MKLLALMGTPRKNGNGVGLLAEMQGAMKRLGEISIDHEFLGDLGLAFCRGCCACISQGEELCPHKSVTLPFRQRLADYDAFVFYSPVYAHGISAMTKNFIDHFAYLFHRPALVDRPALALVTTDGSGIRETLAYLRWTAVGFGCHYVGGMGVAAELFRLDDQYRKTALTRARQLAERLYQATTTGRRRAPNLYELMFFRAMRTKARFIAADRKYWEAQGWLRQSYFVERPLNPVANALAAASDAMTRWHLRSQLRKLGHRNVDQAVRALDPSG